MDFELLLNLSRIINRASVFFSLLLAFSSPLVEDKVAVFPWKIVWYGLAVAASSGLVELSLSQFTVQPSTTTILVIVGSGIVSLVLLTWMISAIPGF